MSAFNSKKFQERLILPLGAKEIEFSVPACPSTPSKKSNSWRPGNQDSSPSSTASSSPSQQRNRSFSSAFLFPVGRSSSPLLSPIPHTSCPSSPLPPSSPCPSPSYSQFSHIFNRSFKGSRSPQASTALIVEQQEVIDRADTASPILGSSLYTLGSLNPELYKSCHDLEEETIYPDGHIGRVWFSLDYDRDKEKLNIGLMRIRNLKGKDSENTSCDPLVRIQLMPGERRYHQSSVQKKTCNPVYNENFGFHVHHSELAEQSLKVVVLDNSRSRGRKIIGQLIYSLKNSRLESGRQVIKEDLSKEVVNSPLQAAEILLALCYFPPPCDRITVTILQARNIKSIHSDSPDTYVKVTLLNQTKVVKSKKTNVIKDSSEPCYNENFQFRLTTEQIELANITVSVHQAHSKQKDKPIGKLVLGGFMFARGRGLAHWSEAISRPKEHVQKWHQLPF